MLFPRNLRTGPELKPSTTAAVWTVQGWSPRSGFMPLECTSSGSFPLVEMTHYVTFHLCITAPHGFAHNGGFWSFVKVTVLRATVQTDLIISRHQTHRNKNFIKLAHRKYPLYLLQTGMRQQNQFIFLQTFSMST